ncbi:peptidoglycan recognition protein family protein [Bradyrhizobium sp. CCBAU 11386]|uniref:peptidoglycan recognition protein family protein n=1 Tax=Bradyrhizobium sp. CCBAU 11386 TaxID=1630837 RepID=UPI002302083E|nr:N-acetylmuramoyl-L-alanine amidase [Bradyrhizobium sp. CCBAU 11386]
MVGAGKGWHAGAGAWQGVTDGNSHFIGVEAENSGDTTGPRAEAWPDVQMQAYMRVRAAIVDHLGIGVVMVAGHKEYTRPLGRKSDPSFDM